MIQPGFKARPGWRKLIEVVFFPSFCRLCGRFLGQDGECVICGACWAEIKPHRSSLCPSCGTFFAGAGEGHFCGKCLESRPSFSVHRSAGKYCGVLKDIILLYKYRRLPVLGSGLAAYAFRALGDEEALWWGTEIVIPVPLHPRRKRDRGFNQAGILASFLAKLKEIEFIDGVLIKVKNVPPQTSFAAAQRKANVRGAYRIKEEKKIQGKTLLLVDDVYTTGATLEECSRLLKKAGARDVRALTIAQA